MKHIDTFLNSITMYKLVLYSLQVISVIAILFGFIGILDFSGISLLVTLLTITVSCYVTNLVFAKIFNVPSNIESTSISSFILFLILAPISTFTNGEYISWFDLGIVALTGAIAMSSKYVFTYKKKHIFNPAAISLVIIGLLGFGYAYWWVGSTALLPFVAIAGFLIVRKIRRFHLFFSFFVVAIITVISVGLINGISLEESLPVLFLSGPLIFLGTVMLTEPFTTPPTRKYQIIYGAIVGLLYGIPFHIGMVYGTPELALVLGNIFSFIVSPKYRLKLTLVEKKPLAPDIYEFSFASDEKIHFSAGQYFEWTLAHANPDSRGIRRYFTIASTPTEDTIKLGIKIAHEKGSSFKDSLVSIETGDIMYASQLCGDFVLPKDENKKIVFIAGGIGITPFRSMLKYLIDTNQKRDIVLFYAATTEQSFVYKDIFAEAEAKVGLKVVYVLPTQDVAPSDWKGSIGLITPETIMKFVPDHADRMYYLSGPNGMVTAYKKMIHTLGIQEKNIKTDYFPGF